VTKLSRKAQSIQTHREAIPTRYINEMIRILTERHFAWPAIAQQTADLYATLRR